MKNNKGITLLEVMISIVVLGITIVSTIQVMASNNRLVIKNERGLNSINEIESIMEIFSSDPDNFKDNLTKIYDLNNIDVESNTITLYYSSAFIKNNDNSETSYYLVITYAEDVEVTGHSKYSLTIDTYYDGVIYTHSNSNYNQRVIIK